MPTTNRPDLRWKAIDRQRRGWEPNIVRRVARRFRDEYEDASAALQSALTPQQAYDMVMATLLDQGEGWHDVYNGVYRDVSRAFAEREYRGLKSGPGVERKDDDDIAPELINTWEIAAADYTRQIAGEKIQGIGRATLAKVRNELGEGLADGESIDHLERRLRGVYRGFSRVRSRTIARTEVIAASNFGSVEGARALGVDLLKEWIDTPDSRTRASHSHEGTEKPIPMDAPFILTTGSRLMFPGDTSLGARPGDTINCRCTVTYVRAN